MPRNMSFLATINQAINKTKFVTRRDGWCFLKAGDIIQQVIKCQGLKKGEKIKKIHLIQIVSVKIEQLNILLIPLYKSYARDEMIKEGFPDMNPIDFVQMFCIMNKCKPNRLITRIEFKYI